MKTALDKVAADFQAATGNTVTISYAGLNALAKQIIEGAPADIFVSAAVNWMDEVEKAGLVAGTRAATCLELAGCWLPAAMRAGRDRTRLRSGGSSGDGKLSMAMVDSVPAGQYGKASLESLGVWARSSLPVAQSDNVRAALALVATGEAPYGIVYATMRRPEPGVTVVGTFPADSHPPITYPGAVDRGRGRGRPAPSTRRSPRTRAMRSLPNRVFAILN